MESWIHIIERAAVEHPEVVALSDSSGDQATYADLLTRVDGIAGGWAANGVQSGDVVCVVMRNSTQYIAQVLGLCRLGAIPALINWRLAPDEVSTVTGLFAPAATVFDDEFAHLLDSATAGRYLRSSATRHTAPPPRPVDRLTHDSVFLIIHTSGTTGRPKGVPLTHGGSVGAAYRTSARMPQTPPGTRHLRVMPFFHLAGMSGTLLALLRHDTAIIHDRFDPASFLDTIERERIVFSNAGPSLLHRICDEQEQRPRDVSSLCELWYGTEPIPPPTLERSLRLLGCHFRQNYGMTEAQCPVTQLGPEDHKLDHPHLLSAGRPFPGWEIRVVDEAGVDVAPGRPGEIWIRGDSMFPGYWNNPEATSAAFVGPTDPPGRAWYRTGDVGVFVDDYLRIVDRVSDMIISGGENVYPAEVERLACEHPDIASAAAVGAPDPQWGEHVHLFVVPTPGATVDAAAVMAWMRDRLAHFKCPKHVTSVEELPRNATGKVLRRELRDQLRLEQQEML